jgi:hypothetical protein
MSRIAASLQVEPKSFRFRNGLKSALREGWSAHRLSVVAGLASMALHAVVLCIAAVTVLSARVSDGILVQASWNDVPPPPDELQLPKELHLALPREAPSESVLSAEALAMAPAATDTPELISLVEPTEVAAKLRVPLPDLPQGLKLDQLVVNYGSAGEAVASVEGAVDRITHEIALSLEEGNVLVLWLMDASISLVAERDRVASRLQRIYSELEQLDLRSRNALLAAVMSFGEQTRELVPPTADDAEVISAIRSVPVDESGLENVFSCVVGSVERYKAFRARERRKMIIVIWTDESGNDYNHLEDAVTACRKLAIPVFTVGPSAMFGLEQGTQAYVHPDDGKTYYLPVDRGPDAVRQERIEMPYWFAGNQYNVLHSGLGPFALTRLALATGGAYLINDRKQDRSNFSLDTMRHYAPEYVSQHEYVQKAKSSPLRSAVLRAVDVTRQRKLKDNPQLRFAPTADNFQQQLREAQEVVAFNSQIIDVALAEYDPKQLDEAYQTEDSPRWKAWHDLTFGRLMAMKVRCDEYNWACAVMKGKGQNFVEKESNRWTFEPAATLNFGSASERRAEEARRLLQRSIDQNPDTPWAILARRELAYPLGFQVREAYEPPPPPPKGRPGNNKPNPARRTEERARVLPREPQVKLPRL